MQGNWLEVEGGEEAVMENDAANTVIPAPSPAITLHLSLQNLPSHCQHVPTFAKGFLWPREPALTTCVVRPGCWGTDSPGSSLNLTSLSPSSRKL